jgi:hypothetical protein
VGWRSQWLGAAWAMCSLAAWQGPGPEVAGSSVRGETQRQVASLGSEPPAARHEQGRASVDSLGNPAPIEPDPLETPGDTLPVTAQDVCTPGYSHKVRNVPLEVKREVYRRYGISQHRPGEYEVDHLISLELGGSNSVRNLWPESYWTSPWNARVKDALENALHRAVCSGRVSLHTAQRAIATDWVAAYGTYVTTKRPRHH